MASQGHNDIPNRETCVLEFSDYFDIWQGAYLISKQHDKSNTWSRMEALKGHVKFLKQFVYLLIRTYASPI